MIGLRCGIRWMRTLSMGLFEEPTMMCNARNLLFLTGCTKVRVGQGNEPITRMRI
jgi:hypothetical protein